MKRLVFNDITKELDFVEQGQEELFEGVKELDAEGGEEDKKEQSKIKNMLKNIVCSLKIKAIKLREDLERNKIFFEISSIVITGGMSLLIAFFGLQINNRTAEIYQKQLEILENDREPRFVLEIDHKKDKKNEFYPIYRIKNDGGFIADGILYPVLEWTIYKDGNFVRVKFNDTSMAQKINSQEESEWYTIDYEKSNEFFDELEKEIGLRGFSTHEYIGIEYVNYKNEKIHAHYSIEIDGMYLVSSKAFWPDECVNIFENSFSNVKGVAEQIKNIKGEE